MSKSTIYRSAKNLSAILITLAAAGVMLMQVARSEFAPRAEVEQKITKSSTAIEKRLDKIEAKIDRLIERGR